MIIYLHQPCTQESHDQQVMTQNDLSVCKPLSICRLISHYEIHQKPCVIYIVLFNWQLLRARKILSFPYPSFWMPKVRHLSKTPCEAQKHFTDAMSNGTVLIWLRLCVLIWCARETNHFYWLYMAGVFIFYFVQNVYDQLFWSILWTIKLTSKMILKKKHTTLC